MRDQENRMAYLGRVILTGLTGHGNPFVGYSISGRKPMSRKRKFEVFPDEGRIYVGPVGPLSEDQEKMKHLIFYNCMRTRDDTLFTTNGLQTDTTIKDENPISSFFTDYRNGETHTAAEEIMFDWGYESDSPIFTPRTALVKKPDHKALFAIAARQSDSDDNTCARQRTLRLDKYAAKFLATYKGHDTDALPWRGDDISHKNARFVHNEHFHDLGETPDEICEHVYDWMDPRYVVSAVAAVWDGSNWVFSEPKNLFNTEEDFQNYLAQQKK